MELKKFYVPGSVEAKEPKVSHVRVRRTSRRWLVAPSLLEMATMEGWASIADGQLTLKTAEGEPNVVFKIVSPPGWYCCFDGKKLNDSKEGAAYVQQNFAGQVSPDQNNPAGWRRDNHYTLELVSGIEPKPEQPLGVALRYAAQQEDRRAGARKKIADRDAKAKAALEAASTGPAA